MPIMIKHPGDFIWAVEWVPPDQTANASEMDVDII